MKEKLKEQCDNFIREFEKFSSDIKSYTVGLDSEKINKVPFKLPIDYKYILSKINAFSLMGTEVLGVDNTKLSIEKIAYREQNETELPMPKHIIPFSSDGRGNYYCFDLNRYDIESELCPIIFWQYGYSNELENLDIEYDSFVEWCNEVIIEWTLEDYNYDGTEA